MIETYKVLMTDKEGYGYELYNGEDFNKAKERYDEIKATTKK